MALDKQGKKAEANKAVMELNKALAGTGLQLTAAVK
jgi:hypothetical protein